LEPFSAIRLLKITSAKSVAICTADLEHLENKRMRVSGVQKPVQKSKCRKSEQNSFLHYITRHQDQLHQGFENILIKIEYPYL
jgi:hypothetical protein